MHIAVAKAVFEEMTGRWPPELAEAYGWILHDVTFPIIDVEFTRPGRLPLRLRTDWSNFDEQPPSVTFLNSAGEPLMSLPSNPTGVFNPGPHKDTGRPFICMAGSKEFHTHESHLNEPWEQYRHKPGYDIGGILMRIWNAWMKGTE